MNEDSLLALLARLCGDITQNDHTDADTILQLQQSVASAIINEPDLNIAGTFQFEQLENFSTQHLDPESLKHLNNLLQHARENPQTIDTTIRVFRRQVPFNSSQIKGSVPDWARGAKVIETLGPFVNKDGRRFWFDIFRMIPVVQLWLQGAAQPFMLLPLEVGNRLNFIRPQTYKIPKGSVWIHADIFASTAPDNLYCGLTVAGGTLNFTAPVAITAGNIMVVPNGVEAALQLNLEQKIVAEIAPDDNGIDAKEATIELPKTLNFTINHTGKSLEAATASWTLYGQAANFTFDNTKPMRWSPEINRIIIPYKADINNLEVLQCKSPVCNVSGKAVIFESSWALSAAVININAPLQAEGTGAMAAVILQGIEVSWQGLKDANLFEKSSTQLKNALVMLMPGRINMATLFASNPLGRQRYSLWQETVNGIDKPTQHIDLLYSKQFFFFYDSLQTGTESIATQTNCHINVDKPVQVNGLPFRVDSLQTIFTLSISNSFQTVILFDDDIIKDNFLKTYLPIPGVPAPPITFQSTAIALNNALLTVSPVNSMLLYGDLKTAESFDKCLLVYSFGLLQYLPTLPDPYAANISLLKRRMGRNAFANNAAGIVQINKYHLTDINALLVCIMNWQNMETPAVNFFLGDKPINAAAPALVVTPFLKRAGIRISTLQNLELIDQMQSTQHTASLAIKTNSWNAVTENNEAGGNMLNNDMQTMMRVNEGIAQGKTSPFRNAFTLLDVSTNADLMGVSLGFSNDRFIFEKTHSVAPDLTGHPISISGLDVHASSRLVQMYALPQISWEPVINISQVSDPVKDPFPGILFFLNDGVPAQIANTGNRPVPIAPIPLSKKLTEWYKTIPEFSVWSYFTLPYGMLVLAMYYKQPDGNNPALELIEQQFPGDLHTGLQIKTAGLKDDINKNKKFFGSAHQLDNSYNLFFPGTGARSILAGSVTEIFNDEFGSLAGLSVNKYVPLERYDFSGYGANVFSHWVNENAALAQTSQAMFDVWRGRTAHEVIQVKSVLYPWAIRVVRTITIYRGSNGFPWRIDSGWKAESNGIYDFRSPLKDDAAIQTAINDEKTHAYKFHPGMVDGVFNVRNIKEDTGLAPFVKPWNKNYGVFIDDNGHTAAVPGSIPQPIKLTPVYFDADVQIDDVTQGATNGRVTSQRMLGYLQLSPRGVFIDEESFAELLTKMNSLGGPVDCMVNINQSKQQMRVTRVEVNPSRDAANNRVFVTAAQGTPVLPKDGSWSVVQHDATSKEVTPLSNNDTIPLVRDGIRNFINGSLNFTQDKISNAVNIAAATELFKALENRAKQFAFLQCTGENKVLFRNPLFEKGVNLLKGSVPDLADAYRLMNSKGIFPKVENLPKMDKIGDAAAKFGMHIIDEGYKLVNNTVADAEKKLVQELPKGPWFIVKTNDVKVYIEYQPTKPDGSVKPNPDGSTDAKLDFDIDSKAREWINKMNDITMVVDLGPFTRLLLIRGKFDTKKGQSPSFIGPELEFGPALKPAVDILVLLSMIATDASYTDILKKGLKIAMSNSPNNWEYKFQADKEIPVLRFPPPLLDTAAAPLRLEAGLKVGVYFNVAIPLPPTNGLPMPSAGAFVEFYGKLSVMCLSVGVGTIFAVGQVTIRISADTVTGPALYMKFGFGVEAVVALPVIGSVSVYFAVGVEMSLDSTQITIAAFVLFKGRAEILGGIVTVTIQIEASGKVQDRFGGETNMIAQVTFSLDISICFIININFTETWQEQRQIS